MKNDFTNEQRWDIIEDYFLGSEGKISSILRLGK
jgi:hypothetical protein